MLCNRLKQLKHRFSTGAFLLPLCSFSRKHPEQTAQESRRTDTYHSDSHILPPPVFASAEQEQAQHAQRNPQTDQQQFNRKTYEYQHDSAKHEKHACQPLYPVLSKASHLPAPFQAYSMQKWLQPFHSFRRKCKTGPEAMLRGLS